MSFANFLDSAIDEQRRELGLATGKRKHGVQAKPSAFKAAALGARKGPTSGQTSSNCSHVPQKRSIFTGPPQTNHIHGSFASTHMPFRSSVTEYTNQQGQRPWKRARYWRQPVSQAPASAGQSKPSTSKRLRNPASKKHEVKLASNFHMLLGAPSNDCDIVPWLQDLVLAPWNQLAIMSRRQALSELQRSNPLWQHLGHRTVEGFYAMILERELIRIRRDVLEWPREWWTANWALQRIRVTNVKRKDDRVSKVVASVSRPLKAKWMHLVSYSTEDWCPAKQCFCGGVIFTVALWRAFGTTLAIETVGANVAMSSQWTRTEITELAVKLATAATDKFQKLQGQGSSYSKVEFCFTRAYAPARTLADDEIRYLQSNDLLGLRSLYLGACTETLPRLFKKKDQLGNAAAAGPQSLTKAIMKIPGFGGTGFIAKEIAEDVKLVALFDDAAIESDKSWAMPGPGARRGLNRVQDRSRQYGVNVRREEQEDYVRKFQKEMCEIWTLRHKYWPSDDAESERKCLRPDVEALLHGRLFDELDCNDIQFQLCEADKFWRALAVDCTKDVETVLGSLSGAGLRVFEPTRTD